MIYIFCKFLGVYFEDRQVNKVRVYTYPYLTEKD